MCDTGKYYQMYKEIRKLNPDDTLQLVLNARDSEEREFFEFLGDFLLKQKQREVVDGNRF